MKKQTGYFIDKKGNIVEKELYDITLISRYIPKRENKLSYSDLQFNPIVLTNKENKGYNVTYIQRFFTNIA